MSVRYSLGANGDMYLEESFSVKKANDEVCIMWEKVPVVGIDNSVSFSLPQKMNCGFFMIEEKTKKFSMNETLDFKQIHIVSALSIKKISEYENRTRIDTSKEHFLINTSLMDFYSIMIKMLSNFNIIHININGEIIEK